MFGPSRSRFLTLLAFLLLAGVVAAPGAGAQTEEDVKRANAERDAAYSRLVEVRADVAAAVEAYEQIREQIFELEYQLDRLADRISQDRSRAFGLEEAAKRIVLQSYINRTPSTVDITLEARSIQEVVTRQTLLERASAVSSASIDRLNAVSRELDRLTGKFEEDRSTLEHLQGEAQLALDQVNLVMQRAQEEFNREDAAAKEARRLWEAELARQRAEEERRRRAAAARSSSGGDGRVISGLICPQAEPMWFRNDWGNARSGGRSHKGNDIFSAQGTKVYAVTGGTLRTRTGGLGGIALWLFGSDGNSYYYAHLDGWASGIGTGTRVKQGTVIGYVGNTGNARGGAHHTHFEIHPGGGGATNPYWTLAQVCRR